MPSTSLDPSLAPRTGTVERCAIVQPIRERGHPTLALRDFRRAGLPGRRADPRREKAACRSGNVVADRSSVVGPAPGGARVRSAWRRAALNSAGQQVLLMKGWWRRGGLEPTSRCERCLSQLR